MKFFIAMALSLGAQTGFAATSYVTVGKDCIGIRISSVEKNPEGLIIHTTMKKTDFDKTIYVGVAENSDQVIGTVRASWYPASTDAEAIYQGDAGSGWENIQIDLRKPVQSNEYALSLWVASTNGKVLLYCVNNLVHP